MNLEKYKKIDQFIAEYRVSLKFYLKGLNMAIF